jgi:hypothetical protein
LGWRKNVTTGGDTALKLASHTITADDMSYSRDGINYVVVEKIVQYLGIPEPKE